MPALVNSLHLGFFPLNRTNVCAGAEVSSSLVEALKASFVFSAYGVKSYAIVFHFDSSILSMVISTLSSPRVHVGPLRSTMRRACASSVARINTLLPLVNVTVKILSFIMLVPVTDVVSIVVIVIA
mgnify:CR=1 FL=1